MEKRYFGKLSFRADPALHAEEFRIINVTTSFFTAFESRRQISAGMS